MELIMNILNKIVGKHKKKKKTSGKVNFVIVDIHIRSMQIYLLLHWNRLYRIPKIK